MRAAEREAVLALLERAFGERALFARYMDFDPAFAPDDFLLALDDGRPVACVQAVAKRIRLRGEAVSLGGIGSVATDPSHRGRGLASELLRRSEARLHGRGMALGLLFTTRRKLYERLGWVGIPARQVVLHGPSVRAEGAGAFETRAFRASDLGAVRDLYERYNAGLEGTTLRDPQYWRGQLRYAGNPGEDFRVAEVRGRVVAYARTVTLAAPLAMEYAHAPGHADALARLLLEQCPQDRALLVRLPPGTELEPALERRAGRLERIDDPTLFWRVLDAPGLTRLAGLAAPSADRDLLRELIEKPPAHYWPSDRF